MKNKKLRWWIIAGGAVVAVLIIAFPTLMKRLWGYLRPLALSFSILVVIGMADGFRDTLQFHYSSSRVARWDNPEYYNPNISWRNKYKNGDPAQGEKFWGSTTVFVVSIPFWYD